MTRTNADNAHQADALMGETTKIVDHANQFMGGLTQSMREVSVASEETAKIIKTIDEIAFQTNLLALNAAVEAARAGEAAPASRWWPTRSGPWPCGPQRPPGTPPPPSRAP